MFKGLLQWATVNQSSSNSLTKVIDKEGSYSFRLYMYKLEGIHRVQLFEEGNKDIIMVPREAVPMKARSLVGIVVFYAPV